MTRTTSSILLATGAAALLWLGGGYNRGLAQFRSDHHLSATEPLEDAPPLIAFTTVILGGFRGLMADALWLRASYLQDNARYFELVQLAHWITLLQPHASEVWAFQAWNMAYNVSSMMLDPRDRWRWVQHGLDVLRNEGLARNPRDPRLYHELGWMYQHKIGGGSDSAHLFYKRQLAGDMLDLLGQGAPDYAALSGDPERLDRLRRMYGLVPKDMQSVDRRYGPLDWRLAPSHAVYWANLGRRQAGETPCLHCDRMIYQSLALLFFEGTWHGQPGDPGFRSAPQPDLLSGVLRAYEEALEAHDHDTVREAYAHFLARASAVLHELGRTERAAELSGRLLSRFPLTEAGRAFRAEAAMPEKERSP